MENYLESAQMSEKRKPVISSTDPDWNREKMERWWSPGKQLLKSIRQYQKVQKRGDIVAKLFKNIHTLEHRFWSAVSGADIPLNCQLGGGLVITHPNGIVIHPQASIGPNCLILQQVTITRDVQIGGHVDIGAGAKILKKAKVGDHAKIGANAVVICDIPPGSTAVGVPARVIPAKKTHLEEDSSPSLDENSEDLD